MNDLYDVLELCLQEMEKGADIETVLARYPKHAQELRPILEASVMAFQLATPGPSPEVERRGRAKVLQQAAQMREEQAVSQARSSRRLWSVPLRRALVSLVVIGVLFISSTRLVQASSTTLPGDNLYPVKRTWEDVRILFTFNSQAREALEVEHENERLEELNDLFEEGRSAKVDFAGMVMSQNGDLWQVSKIPVLISVQTELRAQPIKVGDAVRVRGYTQSGGTVMAERVDLLPAGIPLPDVDDDHAPEVEPEKSNDDQQQESGEDRSGEGSEGGISSQESTSSDQPESRSREFSRSGVVDSVNGNTLVVNGQTLNISGARIEGTPTAGASVKVEGYFDASGVFVVTRIEFEDSGSGESDSGNESESKDDGGDDNSGNSNDDDNGDDGGNDNGGDDNGDNSGSGGGGGDD